MLHHINSKDDLFNNYIRLGGMPGRLQFEDERTDLLLFQWIQ
ncbi:hypothetical protein [Thiospirochaeta perfilievii]|nr:hypothetical protein [Thiospirochaeta perfilievii]